MIYSVNTFVPTTQYTGLNPSLQLQSMTLAPTRNQGPGGDKTTDVNVKRLDFPEPALTEFPSCLAVKRPPESGVQALIRVPLRRSDQIGAGGAGSGELLSWKRIWSSSTDRIGERPGAVERQFLARLRPNWWESGRS